MKFIIHFYARGVVGHLPFDFISDDVPTAKNLDSLRAMCAEHARASTFSPTGRVITARDIVIANIIPIPSGEAAQIGGA